MSLSRVKSSLDMFAMEKSPGSDDWTAEFYKHFFDILGPKIVEVVEETHSNRSIGEVLNSTFLTLIPKKDRLKSCLDYRPISLCNLLYKLITKIIAERIKPILGQYISAEQFAFLLNRQIIDTMGVVQECLHTVKANKK